MSNSISIILRALEYAAVQHQYLRRGGYDRLPYINHLIKVANILEEAGIGGKTELTLIAILHDIREDTDTTYRQLSEQFGESIAQAVEELTDDMSLSYSERKRKQIESAPTLSHQASIIRIADKIGNIRDITSYPIDWPHDKKLRYVENSILVVNQIRGTHIELEKLFDHEAALAQHKLKK